MKTRLLISILFASLAFDAEAALTLLKREPFQGAGYVTNGATRQFDHVTGSLLAQRGGPSLTGTNGWSADVLSTQTPGFGVFTNTANWNVLASAWVLVKKGTGISTPKTIFSVGVNGEHYFQIAISNASVVGLQQYGTPVVAPGFALNQWQWFGIACSNRSAGASHDVRWFTVANGVLTNFLAVTNAWAWQMQNQIKFGSPEAQAGQFWNGRIGLPSLHTFVSFADVTAPSESIDSPMTWFLNPATGDDSADGASPSTAWRTAGRVNFASANTGFIPANSYSAGDTLVVDTTGAPLDLVHTNLTLQTRGLNVKATNAPYWTNLSWQVLTNSHFTAAGPDNVWQIPIYNPTPFAQGNAVAWEDDKWLYHPAGTSFSAVSNYLCTNAGSFWCDGGKLYLHPLGNTDPRSDGKAYTRSVVRAWSLISLDAPDMNFRDCHAGKTSLIVSNDNSDGVGAYVVGSSDTFGGTSTIADCYLYYGSKHILGLVASASDSDVTITNVFAEQAPPGISSSPFVSFMDGGSGESNNVHRYLNCTSRYNVGRYGSTAGDVDNQSFMLMHNSSSGVQFRDAIFRDSTIGGVVGLAVCSNAIVERCTLGGFQPSATVSNIVSETRFTGIGLNLVYNGAASTVVKSCLAVHTNLYLGGQWTGWQIAGTNILIEGNTLDARGVGGASDKGILTRYGPAGLTFRNNIVLSGTNAVFNRFTTADTLATSSNLYRVTGPYVSTDYTNGTPASLSLAQWQALGFDSGSITNDPLLGSDYKPAAASPAIGLGSGTAGYDLSGTYFEARNTAGAYEYLAPAVPLYSIGIGAVANDGTGDKPRTAGQKINSNTVTLAASILSSSNALAARMLTVAQGVTNASTNLAYEVARVFAATNTQGPEDFTVGNQISATTFSGASLDVTSIDATSIALSNLNAKRIQAIVTGTNQTSLFLGTNAPGVGTPMIVVTNAINGTMVGIGKQPASGVNYSLDVAQGINAGGSLVTAGNVFSGPSGLFTWNAGGVTPALARINRGVSVISGAGNGTNHFQVTDTNGVPVFGVTSNGLPFSTGGYTMLPAASGPSGISNGLASLWNSNGFVFLRYSVPGYTTNCDKPFFP